MNHTGEAKKQYTGDYVAEVVSLDDPEQNMRVRVRVRGLFDGVPEEDLPWATYKLPVGVRANDGLFCPVDVGDIVWVDFPFSGDTRYPRITGGVHFCPGSIPNFPSDAAQQSGGVEHQRVGREPAPSASEYHKDLVFRQHGIQMEFRDDGSFSIVQAGTGTEIYMHTNGDAVIHSEGNVFASAAGDLEAVVSGDTIIKTGGDLYGHAGGNLDIHADGWGQIICDGKLLVKGKAALILKGPSRTIIL